MSRKVSYILRLPGDSRCQAHVNAIKVTWSATTQTEIGVFIYAEVAHQRRPTDTRNDAPATVEMHPDKYDRVKAGFTAIRGELKLLGTPQSPRVNKRTIGRWREREPYDGWVKPRRIGLEQTTHVGWSHGAAIRRARQNYADATLATTRIQSGTNLANAADTREGVTLDHSCSARSLRK